MTKRFLALLLALCVCTPAYADTTWRQASEANAQNLIAAVPIYTGSLVVPSGATITDDNAAAGCVGVTAGLVFEYGTNCVTSVSASGNLSSSGGATPAITMTASPTFTAVSTANVTDSALSSGNCVQAGTGGILTTISGACGVNSGTVTGVTASSPLASSGGTAPNITISSSPTFSGTVTGTTKVASGGTIASSANANAFEFANGAGGTNTTAFNGNSGATISGITDVVLGVAANGVAALFSMDGSGNIGIAGGVNAASSIIAGQATAGPTSSGDLAASQSSTCGALREGGSSTEGTLDFGCSTASIFTASAKLSVPNLLDSGLSASSNVCTDGSKNLTTSGCFGVPVACTTSSVVPCYFTWTCTVSSSSNSCSTTQGVPASSVCTTTFNSSPVVTSSVAYPVAGGGGGVATGTLSFPAQAYVTLSSTTLTIHVVTGNAVNANFAQAGNGSCL